MLFKERTQLILADNDICLKYSEEPEKLKALLSKIKVEVQYKDYNFYFDEDKDKRVILNIYISRGKKEIDFTFGMSINDSDILLDNSSNNEKTKKEMLYTVLSCCSSDFYCPIDFEEFCSEFGYDTDSKKAENIWKLCLKQSSKLHKIFSEEEIDYLPR